MGSLLDKEANISPTGSPAGPGSPARRPGEAISAISLSGVRKVYRLDRRTSVVAVRDLNLRVAAGEFIVITGRSGSGKTTLLNLAGGLTRPTTGKVLIDDVDLWRLPDRQQSLLRNEKIGFIFQFPSLLPSLTVLENVVLPTRFGSLKDRAGLLRRALELLQEMGVEDKAGCYPRQLSAGQQKRVVIARSLISEPEILLADEPTGDLDEQTEGEVMALLKTVHTARDVTILLVTHNRELVGYGTRAFEMSDGVVTNGIATNHPERQIERE